MVKIYPIVPENRRSFNSSCIFVATGFPCERQQESLYLTAISFCVMHLENSQNHIWRFDSISYAI